MRFKAVEDAKQGMDTKINEARKYQSQQLPAANARADKATRDAEAYRQQRVSEAEGQARGSMICMRNISNIL